MDDKLNQDDALEGRHDGARRLAEAALEADAAGDRERAEDLMAQAAKADPEAAEDALAEGDLGLASDLGPQDDDEIAAMSRTVQPGSDAPSRAGITGPGSGADGS